MMGWFSDRLILPAAASSSHIGASCSAAPGADGRILIGTGSVKEVQLDRESRQDSMTHTHLTHTQMFCFSLLLLLEVLLFTGVAIDILVEVAEMGSAEGDLKTVSVRSSPSSSISSSVELTLSPGSRSSLLVLRCFLLRGDLFSNCDAMPCCHEGGRGSGGWRTSLPLLLLPPLFRALLLLFAASNAAFCCCFLVGVSVDSTLLSSCCLFLTALLVVLLLLEGVAGRVLLPLLPPTAILHHTLDATTLLVL